MLALLFDYCQMVGAMLLWQPGNLPQGMFNHPSQGLETFTEADGTPF